jgi:acetoin utilization protein AcuB
MLIRDIMTTNVVTIPSTTSIADAKRIMEAHRFQRLPVVDKGKLVGIVTARRLEGVSPSKATSLTVWELTYLLNATKVKEVMEKNVITVSPETTAEEAVALAQSHRVGTLVVLEDNRVVGIVTTNDFFYKIVNPILGLGQPGTRLEIAGAGTGKALEEVICLVNKLGLKIVTLHIEILPEKTESDLCLHVDSDDVSKLVDQLRSKGYIVNVRKRQP